LIAERQDPVELNQQVSKSGNSDSHRSHGRFYMCRPFPLQLRDVIDKVEPYDEVLQRLRVVASPTINPHIFQDVLRPLDRLGMERAETKSLPGCEMDQQILRVDPDCLWVSSIQARNLSILALSIGSIDRREMFERHVRKLTPRTCTPCQSLRRRFVDPRLGNL
jgi:hypothetical protein